MALLMIVTCCRMVAKKVDNQLLASCNFALFDQAQLVSVSKKMRRCKLHLFGLLGCLLGQAHVLHFSQMWSERCQSKMDATPRFDSLCEQLQACHFQFITLPLPSMNFSEDNQDVLQSDQTMRFLPTREG